MEREGKEYLKKRGGSRDIEGKDGEVERKVEE